MVITVIVCHDVDRDKPRAASDRERMTALYNIACCHAQLNDVRSGLVALAGVCKGGADVQVRMRVGVLTSDRFAWP